MDIDRRKKCRERRKALIKWLLEKVREGKFYNIPIVFDDLYQNKNPRRQFIRPLDLSNTNWGYMGIAEMDAPSPNTFR